MLIYKCSSAFAAWDVALLNNLGTTLLMQERFAEGLSVFRQAFVIDSTDARVWNNLGTAFLK